MPSVFENGNTGAGLWTLLDGAHRRLLIDIRAGLEPLDLTPELMEIMYVIDRLDRGTLAQLQAEMGANADADTIAAGVRKLQLRGLLMRARSNTDPALTPLRFTAEGRAKAKRAHTVVDRLQGRAEGWLGSYKESLVVGLQRLNGLPPLPGR